MGEGEIAEPVVIRGSLHQISNSLVEAKNLISQRQVFGWPLFQADERWRYDSAKDVNVCPVCRDFDYHETYRGDQLPRLFPTLERVSAWNDPYVVIHPHVHRIPQYAYLKGECRCRLVLLNPAETMLQRLHVELEEATNV